MPASNTRPTCFDFQVPVDCVNPVEFVDIPESYTLDEDIVVSYRVLKTFRPKSGDWVGLFQCSKTDPDTYVFVTFKWAQKNPEFKEKPLDRRIVFNVEDLNAAPSRDVFYQFLYMTTSERLVGQSSQFTIQLINSPIYSNKMQSDVASSNDDGLDSTLAQNGRSAFTRLMKESFPKAESFSPDLFPISSRFAAGADVKQFHLLSFKPNPGCINCKQAQDAIRLLKKRLFANKQDQIKKSSAPIDADDRKSSAPNHADDRKSSAPNDADDRHTRQDLWVEVEKLAMVVMETREEMRRMKGTAKTLLNQLSEEQKKNAALSDAQQTMEMQLIELTKWFQETLISRNKEKQNSQNRKEDYLQDENTDNASREVTTPETKDTSGSRTTKKSKDVEKKSYSGSNVSLRFLFGEEQTLTAEMTKSLARKLAHDSHYSGSNLTMQRLFREVSNGGGRREDSHYSGSNLTMQKLFEEEPKSRGVGRIGSDRKTKLQEDHYSGSNLTLRRMFDEDTPPSQSVTDGSVRSAGRFTNIRVVESANKAGNVNENKLPTGVKRKGKVVETKTDLAANQKVVQGKIDEKAKTKTEVSTASNDNKQLFDRRLENTAQSTAKSPLISSKYPATETTTGPINKNAMTSGQLGGNLQKPMQITGTASSASGTRDSAKAANQITRTNDLKQSSNFSPTVPKSGGNKSTSPSAAQPAASANEKKVKKASKTERRMDEKQTQTDPTKLATKWTMTTEKKTMSTFTQTDPVFNLAITMKEAEAKLAYGPILSSSTNVEMHESDSKKFKKVKFDVTPASENYDAQTSERDAEEFELVGSSRVKRTKERLESLIHENAKSVSPLSKSSYGKKPSYGSGAVSYPVPRIPAKYLLGNASSKAPHTCDADTENMASLTENAVARAKAQLAERTSAGAGTQNIVSAATAASKLMKTGRPSCLSSSSTGNDLFVNSKIGRIDCSSAVKGNIRESQLEDFPRVHNYASAYINKLNQIVAQQKEVLDSTNAGKDENASNKKFQDLVNKFVERAKLESNDRSAKSGLGVVKPAERRNARKKPVEQSDQEPVDASKSISVQQEIILESNEVDSVSSDNSAQDENTNGRSFWYDSFTDLISTLKSTFTNYVSGTNDALKPNKRASDDDLSDDGFGQMMKYEQTAEKNKFATETQTEETLDLASMVDFPTLASVVGKPGTGTKPTYASIARNGAGQKSGSLDQAMTSAMMQSGSNNQSGTKSKKCNGYINCPGCNAIVYCKCGENVFDRDTDDEDIGDESIACPGCNRRIPLFDINGNLRCLPDSNCKIVHVKRR